MESKHGRHVRVECQFCVPPKSILRFRHVSHVRNHHKNEFKAWYRTVGASYPRAKPKKSDGEQRVNNGEQVVNNGEHVVNNGEHMVNIFKGEHVVNNGEHLVNNGEHLVNNGEQKVNNHIQKETPNQRLQRLS